MQPHALVALVELLLRLFWVLATAAVLVTLTPFPLPQAFKDAVRLSAARGKLWAIKPKALGWLGDVSVPQAWFAHFYAIGAACNAALLLWMLQRHQSMAWQPLLQLLLLQLHLARRLAETRLLMRYPADARMHIIAYIFGLVYYIVVPLSMLTSGSITRLVTEASHTLADPSARLGLARRLALSRLVPAVQNEIQRHATLLQTAGVKAATSSAVSVLRSWAVNYGHWLHALAQRAGAWAMAEWEAAPLVVRLGVVVFLAGNLLQFWSHAALASLPSAAQPREQGRHRRRAQPSSSSTAGTSAGGAAGAIPPGAALAAGIGAAAAAWAAAEPMWLSALGERDIVQLTTTEMLAVSAVVAVVAAVPVSLLLGLPLQNESSSHHKSSATNSSSGAGAGYVIPRGMVFALVSCPHYLGEVVLYLGLVLLTQGSINTLLMLAWVVLNLVLAADATQRWYLSTFPDYPKHRRALIPFLW